MKSKITQEIIVTFAFIILLVLAINPWNLYMPSMITSLVLAGIVLVVGISLGMLLHEQPNDEREHVHGLMASRVGYIAGIIAIVIVVLVQSIRSTPDTALLIVLGVMVLAKLIGIWWSRKTT